MNAWASGLQDKTIHVFGPPGTRAMTAASWQVFDRDITLRMEEEGKPDPRKLVTAQDVGEGVVYKDDTVTVTALKVPHSPFPDGEAFAYRFDTQGKRIVFSGDTSYFPHWQLSQKALIYLCMRPYMSPPSLSWQTVLAMVKHWQKPLLLTIRLLRM